MKKRLFTLGMLVSLGVTSLNAQVKLFRGANFTGQELSIDKTWTAASDWSWNDVITSIQIPDGYKIIIYEHDIRRGKFLELTSDWIAPQDWRRIISNITVIKLPVLTKKSEFRYGYGKPGADFTEFSEKSATNNGIVKRLSKANNAVDKWWSIAQNVTDKEYMDTDHITYPVKSKGSLIMHPGSKDNECTKAMFTAKSDGKYTFTVSWKLVDRQGRSVMAEVHTNAKSEGAEWTSIYKKEITKSSVKDKFTFEKSIVLKKGEQVSIEVENGKHGYNNDSTEVEIEVK